MFVGVIVFPLFILGGLLLMGFGGDALYEGFTRNDEERSMFGEARTARIVGILGLLLGLGLICALVIGAYYLFGMRMTVL
ncbi:MAG: hypothetical protein JXA21_23565 [Anaerolineae bacterium]|nr:hypothetical protein [Anaerolineae bacterium]